MTKARNLADLISDGVIGTTELADDVITPVQLSETGNYVMAQLDVNGTVTSDGLTVETTADNGTVIQAHDNLTTTYPLKVQNAAGSGRLEIGTYGINNNIDLKIQTADTNRINVDTNGDIIMYKDDGSTAGMTFDASSGWMGIGTSSTPNRNLEIVDLDTSRTQVDLGLKTVTNGTSAIFFADTDDTNIGGIRYFHSSNDLEFRTNDSEAMRMTSDGKLKLRTSDNLGNINTHPTYNTEGAYVNGFVNGGGAGPYPRYLDLAAVGDGSWGGIIRFLSNDNSNNTAVERMRLDAAGNLGINEPSPDRQLHITDTSEVNIKLEAGSDVSEIRLKDNDNALTVHLNNSERMGLKSDEVNWTNSTNGFFNKIWGPSSGDVSSGFMTYRGSTARGGFYTNPSHGLTLISEVDISLRANNANRMHIDTSGRVTMPYQPAFCMHTNDANDINYTGSSQKVTATWLDDGPFFNRSGSGFSTSNSRFTAPIDGVYQHNFSFTAWWTGASQSPHDGWQVWLYVNGSMKHEFFHGGGHSQGAETRVNTSCLLELLENDYVEYYVGGYSHSFVGRQLVWDGHLVA